MVLVAPQLTFAPLLKSEVDPVLVLLGVQNFARVPLFQFQFYLYEMEPEWRNDQVPVHDGLLIDWMERLRTLRGLG